MSFKENRISSYTEKEEEGLNRFDKKKQYKLDEFTINVENNGHSAEEVRALIRQLVLSTPVYGTGKEGCPDSELFFLVYVNRGKIESIGDSPNNTIDKPAVDHTKVRLVDAEPYHYIFGLINGKEPDHTKGEGLTRENFDAYQKAKKDIFNAPDVPIDNWADAEPEEMILERLDKKYTHLTEKARMPGITVVRTMYRKTWKDCLDHPRDIAVIRALVSEVYEKFIPNLISIQGFPSTWKKEDIETFIRSLCRSKHPQYPSFEFIGTNCGLRVIVTFDPKYREASFIFHVLMEQCRLTNNHSGLSLRYVPKNSRNAKTSSRGTSKTREDDGFKVQARGRNYRQ